jgi:hypothetical protein
VLAASDLVGLYRAIRQRGSQPLMRRLPRLHARPYVGAVVLPRNGDDAGVELLARLGLPAPDDIARRCPSLPKGDVRT